MREAGERMWNAVEQHVHRETWQDDLERKDKLLSQVSKELVYIAEQNELLQLEVEFLKDQIAEKDAEIARLNVLLEGQAKRKPR